MISIKLYIEFYLLIIHNQIKISYFNKIVIIKFKFEYNKINKL